MFINSPEVNQNDESEIFTRPPRSARRMPVIPHARLAGTVACAVCGLRAEVLICKECAEQPETSRQRVLGWLQANVARANTLLAEWDAAREPNQTAWDKIQAAREQPDYAAKCAQHRAAGNIYGRLLDAHARYEQALQPLDIERARLEKALAILDTL